ncbi:hypothetical protein GS444_10750 [Rhodococcus hoagii]|nr:hypothetical protein [Prescottella equi]
MTNGAPHYIGRDIEKGDPVAYELPDGTVEVDSPRGDRDEESPERIGYRLQIGSGDAEREPGAIALGKFRKLASVVSRVALGG